MHAILSMFTAATKSVTMLLVVSLPLVTMKHAIPFVVSRRSYSLA